MFSDRPRRSAAATLAGFAAALTLAVAPVTANGGGGDSDLGLDAISIASTSVEARTGLVTITGQIGCSQDLEAVWIGTSLSQVVGRFHTIWGWGSTEASCLAADGVASFEVAFYADNGRFAPGSARLNASADVFFCTEENCFGDSVSTGDLLVRLGRS